MKKIVILLLLLSVFLVSCDEETKGNTSTPLVTVYDNVDLSEYMSLLPEDYTGVEYTPLSTEVTDAEVSGALNSFTMELAEYVEIVDQGAEKGDVVTLDYSGAVDGVVFDGGTATNQQITLGAGGYIEGFEEGIYSHKTGETFVVDAYFPENYGKENLNGKTAQFTMTIHKIERIVYPELTDALVAENSEYKTIEELKAAKKAELASEKATQNKLSEQQEIYEKVYNKTVFKKYPEKTVKEAEDALRAVYQNYADMYQMSLESFLTNVAGSSVEEFNDYVSEYAKSVAEVELISFYILKNENILSTLTEEGFAAHLATLSESSGISAEELIETNGRDSLVTDYVWTVAMDFIHKNGKPIK